MILRLQVILPQGILVSRSDGLLPFEMEHGGEVFRIYPPFQIEFSEDAFHAEIDADSFSFAGVLIDGQEAYLANAMQIEALGDFDRGESFDVMPTVNRLLAVLRSLFERFRSVTRSSNAFSLDEKISWSLRYLQDSGEEFAQEAGLVRGRGRNVYHMAQQVFMFPEIWNELSQRQDGYQVPPSDELLLDAHRAYPDLGTAVLLAFMAIEVRISTALDILAERSPHVLSREAWAVLTNRRNQNANPSVEEQLTKLFKLFTGKSLDTENSLWNDFLSLKRTRNSFVHKGRAQVSNGEELSESVALGMLASAQLIVDWVEEQLPAQYQRRKVELKKREMVIRTRIA